MSEGFRVLKRFFHWGPFTAIGRCLLSHSMQLIVVGVAKTLRCEVMWFTFCAINIAIMFTKLVLLLCGVHYDELPSSSIVYAYVLQQIRYIQWSRIFTEHTVYFRNRTHFMPNYVNQASPEQHLQHHRPPVCIANCYKYHMPA